MILLYKDAKVFDMVRGETPFIGTCHIRGDFLRDEQGVPAKAELTTEPVVSAPVDKLGRVMQAHPWSDEDMAEFEKYWEDYFADGRLEWHDNIPEDWEATADDEEAGLPAPDTVSR